MIWYNLLYREKVGDHVLSFYLAALDTEDEQMKMTEIYEKYKAAMLRYALSIVKNKEIAEEAVQNTFVSVIEHKEKYLSLSGRELRNLIIIITKNKSIDILRQRNAFVDKLHDEMEDVMKANYVTIEEKIILSEEYESIKKHVAALDEMSRLVLEMKYLLGMSYKEIGEQLGISPKHVDTRLMRAKAKVRRLVEKGSGAIG